MRAFIVMVVLVGAAAAAEEAVLQDDSVDKIAADSVDKIAVDSVDKIAVDNLAKIATDNLAKIATDNLAKIATDNLAKIAADRVANDAPVVVDEMRMLSIYGMGKSHSNFYLAHEKEGVKALYDKPIFLAFRSPGKSEITIYFLKNGLLTAYGNPVYSYMIKSALSGPKKVGLMLSAVNFLNLPEASMPINEIKIMGKDVNMRTMFRMFQNYPLVPVVYMMKMEDLPVGGIEKLTELGQFEARMDKLTIVRDFMSMPSTARRVQHYVPVDSLLEEDDVDLDVFGRRYVPLPVTRLGEYAGYALRPEPEYRHVHPVRGYAGFSGYSPAFESVPLVQIN